MNMTPLNNTQNWNADNHWNKCKFGENDCLYRMQTNMASVENPYLIFFTYATASILALMCTGGTFPGGNVAGAWSWLLSII
jgi:hypothetical protein